MFSSLQPLTLASTDGGAATRFSGYAYVGPDVILGEEGFQQWSVAHPGEVFPNHEDGCYIHARRMGATWSVAGDFKGYCKIYYYERGQDWAFSNSFSQLVTRVRDLGWPVTPEPALMAAWQPMPTFWQQLATIGTAVREIRLLPRQATLVAGPTGIAPISHPIEAAEPNSDAYRHRLRDFMNQWVGRLLGVLGSDGGQLQLELTGGRDSRTTLALALAAKQMSGEPVNERLAVRSSTAHPKDLACARDIAGQYGLRFNEDLPTLGQDVIRLAPFERWSQFALGSYGPIVLPPGGRQTGVYTVGGHGGEGHRAFYAFLDLYRPIDSHKDVYGTLRTRLKELMAETKELLQRDYPGTEPLMAHYKEFRDRLHSGLHSLHQVRMQPLSSRLLELAMRHSTLEAALRGQVLFDIMSAAAPALPHYAFEVPEKSPSPETLRALLGGLALTPEVGRVFGTPTAPPQPEGPQGWARFVTSFKSAKHTLSGDVLPATVWQEAQAAVDLLAKGKRLGHARDSVRLHQVLLAALVYG